jgi:hypothetical protein
MEELDATTILFSQHGYVSLAVAAQMLNRSISTVRSWVDQESISSAFHDDVLWVQLREVAAFSKHSPRSGDAPDMSAAGDHADDMLVWSGRSHS